MKPTVNSKIEITVEEVVTTFTPMHTSYKPCHIAPIAKQQEYLYIILDQLSIKCAKMVG